MVLSVTVLKLSYLRIQIFNPSVLTDSITFFVVGFEVSCMKGSWVLEKFLEGLRSADAFKSSKKKALHEAEPPPILEMFQFLPFSEKSLFQIPSSQETLVFNWNVDFQAWYLVRSHSQKWKA